MKKVYGFMIKGALIASLLVLCLPITTVTYAKEQNIVNSAHLESYSMQINRGDKQQTIQTQGFTQDGVMMIAARDLFDAIGVDIRALGASKTTFIVEANEMVQSTIFNKFMLEDGNDSIKLSIVIDDEDEESMDEDVNMPTSPTVINGQLYIPLEFITAIFNYDVKYDYIKNIIMITLWNNKEEQVEQIEKFVHRYMNNVSDGYSSDLSLYTSGFLAHDDYIIDMTFSDENGPEPHLALKDWTIRYLFFISHNEAMVKIPYLEEGKVSQRIGATWLRLIRTENGWKVENSTAWSQPVYIDGIKEQIHNLKLNEPEQVKAIKKGVYAAFSTANANKKTIEGTEVNYKTFPKNIQILYVDDQIAYVSTEYSWSFEATDENLEKYNILSDKDFITMKKMSNGEWNFKTHYGLALNRKTGTSSIRGDYTNLKYTFFAFDSYYWNSPASIN